MNVNRILKHSLMTQWHVRKCFPDTALDIIEQEITRSESQHSGELRFVVEGALDGMPLLSGQSAREQAIDVFSQLRIWDTEHNNGLLIYLLLADRAVEIVADRGIDCKVGDEKWQEICRKMEQYFAQNNFKDGVIYGIKEITQLLVIHFPGVKERKNELPNTPVVM